MRGRPRRIRAIDPPPTLLPLGFGPFSGLIPSQDHSTAQVWATFRPDPLPRPPTEAPRQPKTAHRGPDSRQDHPHRPQE